MWGRLEERNLLNANDRFTPTDVGTTGGLYGPKLAITVYPHGCGDDFKGLNLGGGNFGLPPRLWGRLARYGDTINIQRFTPTDVGTTLLKKSVDSVLTVYPHGCGDDPIRPHLGYFPNGLPPRMWGRR